MREKVIQKIIEFFKTDIVNDETLQIDENEQILMNGLIDSMGIIRLMVHLQSLYEINEFDQADMTLDNFRTIGSIADMVLRYIESKQSSTVG